MRVTTPWMMKSHCQPAIPARKVCQCPVRSGSELTRVTYHAVHFKDSQGNQSRKSRSKNVSSIKNRDPRGQLLPRVERRQNIQCTRVIRSLRDTEEEPREQQTSVISADSSQATNDSPHSHAGRHPYAGLHPRDDHVRWDADDNVPCKEDGDAGLVLLWS